MKYFAQILIRPNTETHEVFKNKSKFYSKFKALFITQQSKVIKESFSVPDFLMKLNLAFKSVGISNLARITHDDVDFYLDKEHKPNDLDEAIQEFGNLIHNSFERFFEEITSVFETKEAEIDYLIELILLRVHPVGEYPVQINFSGLPEKHGVANIEQKFRLFVDRVEQSLHKYMELSDITVSFTKKDRFTSPTQDQEELISTSQASPKKGNLKCNFFPLYGVMLGETTVSELEKMGTKAKDFDSEKKLYKYYTIKDMRFWYSGEIADHMYITYTDPIPKQWSNCGLDWSLSYNEWKDLFEKLGFFISIVKQPVKDWYNGKRSLSAEFIATKKINATITISFELDFSYSQKTSVDSKGTIYSLRVRAS